MQSQAENARASFHRFPDLPPELRRIIWLLALDSPRRLLQYNAKRRKQPLSKVSRESRTIFKSVYTQLIFPNPYFDEQNLPIPVWANLSQDALFLDGIVLRRPKWDRPWLKWLPPHAVENIKYIIYEFGYFPGTWRDVSQQGMKSECMELQRQLLPFRNLENLYLKVPVLPESSKAILEIQEGLEGRVTVKALDTRQLLQMFEWPWYNLTGFHRSKNIR